MTKFIAAAKTQAGTNHPVNEDRLLLDGDVLCYGLVGDCEREMGCMAVFDGVSEGGHGAAASTLAAQAFAQATQVFEADSIDVLHLRLPGLWWRMMGLPQSLMLAIRVCIACAMACLRC